MIAADLIFDAEHHVSVTPDGRDVPHVTSILSAVGVSLDFNTLARIANVDVELARARGSAVHADCHAYDDDDLDMHVVDSRVMPYLDAWARCRASMGLNPIAHQRERQVFHAGLWYTGILDGIFTRDVGGQLLRILIDLKTGDPDDAAAHLQTAAYEAAWLNEHLEPIDERWAVWLKPEKRIPYDVINYTARPDAFMDYGKFMACLTVYNEQPRRRGLVR